MEIHYIHAQLLWKVKRYLRKKCKKHKVKLKYSKILYSAPSLGSEGIVNFTIFYTNSVNEVKTYNITINEDCVVIRSSGFTNNKIEINVNDKNFLENVYKNFVEMCKFERKPSLLSWWQKIFDLMGL